MATGNYYLELPYELRHMIDMHVHASKRAAVHERLKLIRHMYLSERVTIKPGVYHRLSSATPGRVFHPDARLGAEIGYEDTTGDDCCYHVIDYTTLGIWEGANGGSSNQTHCLPDRVTTYKVRHYRYQSWQNPMLTLHFNMNFDIRIKGVFSGVGVESGTPIDSKNMGRQFMHNLPNYSVEHAKLLHPFALGVTKVCLLEMCAENGVTWGVKSLTKVQLVRLLMSL